MTSTTPLPTLFGRFSAIQHQHDHLNSMASRLAAMCEAIFADSSLPAELEPKRLIAEWSVDLSRHFAGEEAINYFGTVAAESPALVTRIADLRAEHAAMLDEIELLVLLSEDPLRSEELARRTRALLAQFRSHEVAETALLKEFFETFGADEP